MRYKLLGKSGVAGAVVGDDLPGRDVHRCEQIDGAVAFVVIAGQQGMVVL